MCSKPMHKAGRCIDHYLEWNRIKQARAFAHAKNPLREIKKIKKSGLAHPSGRQLKKLRRFEKQQNKPLEDVE